jgi:hypothetical protein
MARDRKLIVHQRIQAAETAIDIACPLCGQQAGQTCVTKALNEAAFTHMKRVNERLRQIQAGR